jgi:hypothetical protein
MHKQASKYSIIITLVISISFLASSLNCFAVNESISNPYKTATNLKLGSIVSLDTAEQNEVVEANTSNEQRLVGVTVNGAQSLLAVNDATNTTQVVSSGIAETLVSTMDGPIVIGTQIAVSPISGVGAKASASSKILGIAEASFNYSTSGAISQNIYDTSHHLHKIYIGYIPVLIAVNNNTNSTTNSGFINSLRNLVTTISGHSVSNISLAIVCAIVLIAFFSIIVLVYGAITGGLISIGRNPLARNSIFGSLAQIFVMVLIIAATSVAIIYFILH